MPLFPFVQFEFTHSIGPPEGRYIVHPRDRNGSETFAAAGGEVPPAGTPPEELDARLIGTADVLAIKVREAAGPTPRRFRSGPPKVPDGAAPTELSVTVVTVILATRKLADETAAARWMQSVRGSEEEAERTVELALGLLRRGVVAYRLAAADPYVPDLSPLDARATRIGWGEATAVVRGGWTEAFGVKPARPPRLKRTERLMPVQAMAAMLSGSMETLEAEELILSAIRDLDNDRNRGAAMTLAAAQELLLAELAGAELAPKVTALVERVEAGRDEVRQLAGKALVDQLTKRDAERLGELAEDAGALIDAWRYVPLGFA